MTEYRPSEVACKVCGGVAPLHGAADFNKTCEERRGRYLPMTQAMVWYHRCSTCGFLFTCDFDKFSPGMWRANVYNEGYASADPDGATGERARSTEAVARQMLAATGARTMLDYGCGDGALVALLSATGVDAVGWDPIAEGAGPCPGGPFDLVTAFEVLEHTPMPRETMAEMASRVAPGGHMLLSTLLLDGLPPRSMDHWYIAPRNGHVSIHTRLSLGLLLGPVGFDAVPVGEGLFAARRQYFACLSGDPDRAGCGS